MAVVVELRRNENEERRSVHRQALVIHMRGETQGRIPVSRETLLFKLRWRKTKE